MIKNALFHYPNDYLLQFEGNNPRYADGACLRQSDSLPPKVHTLCCQSVVGLPRTADTCSGHCYCQPVAHENAKVVAVAQACPQPGTSPHSREVRMRDSSGRSCLAPFPLAPSQQPSFVVQRPASRNQQRDMDLQITQLQQ